MNAPSTNCLDDARNRFDLDSPLHPDYDSHVLGFNAMLDESQIRMDRWYNNERSSLIISPKSDQRRTNLSTSPKQSRFQVMVSGHEWDSVHDYFNLKHQHSPTVPQQHRTAASILPRNSPGTDY